MQDKKSLFLHEFTKQIILNTKKISTTETTQTEKKPKIEKKELKSFKPTTLPIPDLIPPISSSQVPIKPKIHIKLFKPFKNLLLPKPTQKIPKTIETEEHGFKFPPKFQELKPEFKPQFHPEFQPEFKPIDFDLGKLNMLIKDPTVTTIECPGPGKFLLVRKMREVNVTKITLTENEIKEIIQKFSEKAKIPLISGVFRAAAGNMLITALESEYVGTRFVITKYSPRIQPSQIFY